MRKRLGRFRLGLGFVILLPAAAARAQNVPVDHALRDFESSGSYVLTVDGKVTDAEIYESNTPAVLVISPVLPTPVLLRPGKLTVETVPLAKVARQDDGSVGLLADAEISPLGKYKPNGPSVAFTYGAQHVSLDPRPPLVGRHTAAELLAHDPAYARNAAEYRPGPTAIATLRAATVPVTVRVFFGSWCPYCKLHVPNLLRAEQELAGSNVTIEYYGLPSPPAAWKDPEAERLSVKSTPTAIVSIGGKAVGRLVGDDWRAPEVELARLVAAHR
ncbi:MAG TPA: thioredoxin family protein [Thermoanaerobaculia bacterium]|jgi:thiol-disulfide isomerase/thioredoxin|nr:thioredoxin family protein [Thermoanaerobaculia bacterium]